MTANQSPREAMRLIEFLKRAVDLTMPLAQFRRCFISVTLSEDSDVKVLCQPERMTQAIVNILENAIYATPSGGVIHVHVEEIDNMVRITVADQGIGFPFSEQHDIGTAPFTTKQYNLGIGLMVTRHIVEEHLGQLMLMRNMGSHRGTLARISLPFLKNGPASSVNAQH